MISSFLGVVGMLVLATGSEALVAFCFVACGFALVWTSDLTVGAAFLECLAEVGVFLVGADGGATTKSSNGWTLVADLVVLDLDFDFLRP